MKKKHNEKPVVVSFGAVGPACFSRGLDGPGRTDYLKDVDPSKFYTDVTDYQHFFDPWGSSLGPDVGTTCHLGKPNDDLKLLKTSRAYKYCSEIQGYSGSTILVSQAAIPKISNLEVKAHFASCKFFTHTQQALMEYLKDDDDLKNDGTTAGGCVKYDPDKMVCPSQSSKIAVLGASILALIVLLGFCFGFVVPALILCRCMRCGCYKEKNCCRNKYDVAGNTNDKQVEMQNVADP